MGSMDLDQILSEAVSQQALRREKRRRSRQDKIPSDYANRLAEKALYRRLIDESDVAQDGVRFRWFFSQPLNHQGRPLEAWRRRIDKEIESARNRCALRAIRDSSLDGSETGEDESRAEVEQLPDED